MRKLFGQNIRRGLFPGLLTLVFLAGAMNVHGQQATRRVLILTGSDPNFPGFAIITKSIRSTLRDRSLDRVELIYEIQQGLIKDSEPQTSDEELIGYLKDKYDGKRIDLVLVMIASRFRVLADKDPSLFRDVPKIFYDYDNERDATNYDLGPNITGVWAGLDRLRSTLDLALALNPEARKVVVIAGDGPSDKIILERAQAEFRPYQDRAEFIYLIGGPIEETKRQLAALDRKSIVLFASFSRDKIGNNYSGPEVLSMIAPASAAPVYGSAETLMGLGIMGGQLLDLDATGKRIGEMSLRVLAGEKPEQIPQETAPTVLAVDWRELQRWAIGAERLPPGAVVRFKQPSFWEAYKWYAINLVGAVIVETILIAWLLFLRARRRQAEEENLRLAQLANAQHKRLDEIVSNVPGVVWETLLDSETKERKTTFVSDYVRKMLGYTAEEWLSAPPGLGLRLIPEPDRERAERESEAVVASGTEGISQFRWLAKDGRPVWTESYLNPMKDEGGKVIGLRGVTLDITERKLAEQSVIETKERDRALLNAIPDLMFLQTRDGVYVDYHAKDAKDLMVPPEVFLGKNMREVLPPELAERLAQCFEHAEETGEPQIVEYTLPIDDIQKWFEARIVRAGDNVMSVIRDISERVADQEAIKRSEAQLAVMIGSAMDAIITVDESQRILLFNEAAEKMFGCAQTEAIGESFERFIPETFRNAHRERISDFAEKRVTGALVGTVKDLWGVRSSGEEFPMEASISRIYLSGQKFYTIILRDITERKAAEEAVRAERELLEVVVRHMPACVCLIRGSDLGIQMINPAYQAIAPGKEMIGMTLDELWPEAGQNFTAICQRVLETGEPYEVTDELNTIRRGPDEPPESAYFSWSLHRVRLPGNDGWGLLCAGWETTMRKQAEDALRESEERFGKAFRANPQPMSVSTVADGIYIYVNESFLSTSGYAREEVIGRTALELKIWETPECRVDFVRQVMESGAVVNVETKFRTKAGFLRTLLASGERLDLGGIDCLLIASSDITERIQAQQALAESEERFRNMADSAPVMIWVTGNDKSCTYLNQQWYDFTGRTMGQELGTGWAEGIHPDDRARCLEKYYAAFDRREPFRVEYRLRRADSVYRWLLDVAAPRFSSTGEFLGYIGSCIDITDRKESEESLRLAHEEVSSLKNQLQQENIYLQEEIRLQQSFGEIIGDSDALKYVLFKIEQVAPTESTVLITGETGTGKELVAAAIHKASTRADRPLVRVNCAALSASLIESELFGHEKGAFTGASATKIGRFELAKGATIFLDEIGELPPESQGKLLRVIQEGEFERLGSSRTIKVDVRIIAATNRNLDHEVKKGLFREDLWYRLNVFPITVPPLRQRREDIPLLVEHFVSKFAKKLGKVITSVSPTTLKSLRDYSWRGNVRELANVIERAVINSKDSVLRIGEDLGLETVEQLSTSTKTLEEMERDYILRVLEDRGWRIEGQNGAARLLGLNPSTLRTRMVKLGIHRQSFSAASVSSAPVINASRDDN
jgi:PAS domain S-box-containing protein